MFILFYTLGFKHIKSSTLLYLGFVLIDSSFKNSYVFDNTVNILSNLNYIVDAVATNAVLFISIFFGFIPLPLN